MPCLGITGGIATGKSSFTQILSRLIPTASLFDADDYSRKLLMHDPEVQSEIRQQFGIAAFGVDATPDRAFLRNIVFNDPQKLKILEGILHPRIRAHWTGLATLAKNEESWLIIDIPLLFETEAESFFNKIVVVASSYKTQIRRLVENRNLSSEMASRIIASQFQLELKIKKADHVIWNEGSLDCLEEQAIFTAALIQNLSAKHAKNAKFIS